MKPVTAPFPSRPGSRRDDRQLRHEAVEAFLEDLQSEVASGSLEGLERVCAYLRMASATVLTNYGDPKVSERLYRRIEATRMSIDIEMYHRRARR